LRSRVIALILAILFCGALATGAVRKRASAAAAKAAPKRAPAKSVAAKKGTGTGAARTTRAGKRPRNRQRRTSYVKQNPVPAFKPFELAGWPQLASLAPAPAQAFPPPPDLPRNCPLCETQLLSTAYSLIGTRYRPGGTTPETGFDCSGFVKYVYQMNFPVDLPPSAPLQYQAGMKVDKEELEPGDLVFFRTRRGWHVGMYVGQDSFIHAPNHRKTVSVSPLFSDAYWRRAFVGARRIEVPAPDQSAELASNN
jgi:cell wall-associated NlpC family hydrolase